MSLKHDLDQCVSNLPFIRQTLAVYPRLPEPIAWEGEERRSRSLGAARIGRSKPIADFD